MVVLEDESLRDGLQFEQQVVPYEQKIALFELLRKAGLKRIQIGSFVNPKVVPQMADTDRMARQLHKVPEVLITGLVLNDRGLERAMASGLRHISLSVSVSDAHSRRNVRKSSAEALASVSKLIQSAVSAGMAVRAGLMCSFGCVYEGAIDQSRVLKTLDRLQQAGAIEFNLADTTGMANPRQVKELVAHAAKIVPVTSLSLHLHNTRGLAIANMVAGFEAGVHIFDTSAGGLGGCPFVKGAAGNIATEDAVNLFESMGVDTGIDLDKICGVSAYYEQILERRLPGCMGRVLAGLQNCDA